MNQLHHFIVFYHEVTRLDRDDFVDIDFEEIKQFEEQLRIEYRQAYATDYIERDTAAAGGSDLKKSDSFASLMNILNTMRKSNISKSVSTSRLNLMQNMREKEIVPSKSSETQGKPAERQMKVAERRESMEKIIAGKEITNRKEELSQLTEIMKVRKVREMFKNIKNTFSCSGFLRHPQIPQSY